MTHSVPPLASTLLLALLLSALHTLAPVRARAQELPLTVAGFASLGVGGLILLPIAIARRVRWGTQRQPERVALVPAFDPSQRTDGLHLRRCF